MPVTDVTVEGTVVGTPATLRRPAAGDGSGPSCQGTAASCRELCRRRPVGEWSADPGGGGRGGAQRAAALLPVLPDDRVEEVEDPVPVPDEAGADPPDAPDPPDDPDPPEDPDPDPDPFDEPDEVVPEDSEADVPVVEPPSAEDPPEPSEPFAPALPRPAAFSASPRASVR